MSQPGLNDSEDSSGEEELHVANPEPREANQQKKELQACHDSQPTASAEPLTPSSPGSGEPQLAIPVITYTFRAQQMKDENRATDKMAKCRSPGLTPAAC